MRHTSFVVRVAFLTCLALGLVSAGAAQNTVVPPTATPEGFAGTPAAPAVAGTPNSQTGPVLRLNPDLLRVVAYTSDGVNTSALIAPVAEDVHVFVPNPTDPNQFVTVDSFGTFTLWTRGEGQGLPAPFTPFAPADRASNDKLVVDAAWTPDGTTLAVVLDNPDRKSAEDGVYWWEIGVTGANQIMHNCRPGAVNCNFFVSSDGVPANWYATSAAWSPDGERLITRAFMDGYGYDGFLLMDRNTPRTQRPPFCPYEFSEWTPDSTRLVVSGRDNNNLPTLGTVTPDCQTFEPAPIWGTEWYTRDGVMHADGTLYTLARLGGREGAYMLIDGNGNELTAQIGLTMPVDVEWNPTHDAVYVRTEDGRSYIAAITGEVSEITDLVGTARDVAWVDVE
jgi:hypothetical protein